jgi:peptidoglycan/LPS O-acetylase OafA/YrhL
MGILRFLLAICVVAAHARSPFLGLPLLQSGLAVKTFFMISGFYMTLILTSKYHADQGGGYWLFISNRFLRIYPSYLMVFAGSLSFLLAASAYLHRPVDRLRLWVDAWNGHHYLGLAMLALSQVSIFGMDLVAQFNFSAAHGFGVAGSAVGNPAWNFNILRQSWSVSVEMMFYLLAPFICVARRWVQVAIVLVAAAAHLLAWRLLPTTLAWNVTYYSFPLQLGYLTLGVLSFYLVNPLFSRQRIHPGIAAAILAPFAGTILFWGWMPETLAWGLCIGLAFFAIPLLFNLTRRLPGDRFFGDLSYPMYLAHIPCKWLMLACMRVTSADSAIVPAWMLLAFTVLVATALVRLVDYPVDRWRQARVARMMKQRAAMPGATIIPMPVQGQAGEMARSAAS